MLNPNFEKDRFTILAGNPAIPFAKDMIHMLNKYHVAKNKQPIELGKMESTVFPGGEPCIKILDSVRKKNVHIVQCFRQTKIPMLCQDVMELLVIQDAVKRAGASEINIYLPYLPFQRQERKTSGREPISAKLIVDLFNVAGGKKCDRITSADSHSSAGAGFSDGPVDILTAWPLWFNYIKYVLKLKSSEIVIVAPDAGAAKMARGFSEKLDCAFAIIEKRRPHEKKDQEVEVYSLIGKEKVLGKIAIIIDDMIATGGSLVEATKLLIEEGAIKVYAFATHGLFNDKNGKEAEEKLYDAGIKVITTDSIPEKIDDYWHSCNDWLEDVISLSKYFADALFCNETAGSLSNLMRDFEKEADKNILLLKDLIKTRNLKTTLQV